MTLTEYYATTTTAYAQVTKGRESAFPLPVLLEQVKQTYGDRGWTFKERLEHPDRWEYIFTTLSS